MKPNCMECKHHTIYRSNAAWLYPHAVECLRHNWRMIRSFKVRVYKHLTPPEWCPGFEPVEAESRTPGE